MVFLKEMAALASRINVDTWTVPPGRFSLHTFPGHIMHYHLNVYKDNMMFEKCQHISLSQWLDRWCGRLYSRDVATLLVLDISARDMK